MASAVQMNPNLSSRIRHWIPALAGMTCLGLGAGLVGIYGFFVDHLSKEFDVGVATLNIAPVALLLVPGFVAPFVGRLVDRVPIRRLLLSGATLAMLSLFLVSRSPTLALAGLCFLGFAAGLTLYGPVAVNSMLVKLYEGQEARALAIAAIGISLATAVLPPLVGNLLGSLDWRTTLATLSVGLGLLLWLVILVGIPAGVGASQASADETTGNKDPALYRQRTFWLIGLGIALGFNAAMVLAICYPPHFMAEGYTAVQAGWFLAFTGIAGLVGKAVVAGIGESLKMQAKFLVGGLLLLQASGLFLLLNAGGQGAVLLALAMLGSAGGAFLPMHSYINSRYYPPEKIGRVTGAQMPLFLPFALVGPPLAGYVFDQSGSYQWVLTALVAVLVLGSCLFFLLPRPRD
ncbi:MAG: MFS transporter [Pseudomonadota bacterium]